MFTSTPPARQRRAASGTRRQTLRDSELPYISPISNYSYGSTVASLPKAPRLSDTRVSISVGMKVAAEQAEARLREQQEQREREASNRSERHGSVKASMPPPSRRGSQRLSREPSVALIDNAPPRAPSEVNDLSALSGIENSRGYTSEFVIDPVISETVRQVSDGRDQPIKRGEPSANGPSQNTRRKSKQPEPMHTEEPSSEEPDDQPDPLPGGSSISPKPLGPSTRSNRARRGADAPILHARGLSPTRKSDDAPKELSGHSGSGPSKGTGSGGKGGKGNKDEKQQERKDGNGGNGGDRPPGNGGTIAMIPHRKRRSRRTTLNDDLDDRPPNFWQQPFDWLFRYYYTGARWQIKMFFSLTWTGLIIFMIYQYAVYFMDGKASLRDYWTHSIYIPPMEAPNDFQDLANRVHSFEKNLGRIDSRLGLMIDREVSAMKSALSSLSSQAAASSHSTTSHATQTKDALSAMRSQLDSLQKSTKQYKERIAAQMKKTEKKLEELLPPKDWREEVDNAVRDALPSQLAARVNPDGSVELSDEFHNILEEVFDKFFPSKFQGEIAKVNVKGIKGTPSWESFLKANEKKLRTKIDEVVRSTGSQATENQAVLNRDLVMKIVREKMDDYLKEWQREALYPAIDSRLKSFKHSFERGQSVAFSSAAKSASAAASTAAAIAAQRAISRVASKDRTSFTPRTPSSIQIPDYANRLIGGRIWPYITSPSYDVNPFVVRGLVGKLWTSVFGTSERSFAPAPIIAITPTTDVGDCWPFPGQHGTLVLLLANSIHPSHITIENVAKELVPDFSSAPKKAEFWIWIKDDSLRATVEKAAVKVSNATGQEDPLSRHMVPQPIPPNHSPPAQLRMHSKEFVKLHTVEFDIDGDVSQSYELPVDMLNLGAHSRIAALVIRENYGNPNYTCLYRVRVHGHLPETKSQ